MADAENTEKKWFTTAIAAVRDRMNHGSEEPGTAVKKIQELREQGGISLTDKEQATYNAEVLKAYENFAKNSLSEMKQLKLDPKIADRRVNESLEAGVDILKLYPKAANIDEAKTQHKVGVANATVDYEKNKAAEKQMLVDAAQSRNDYVKANPSSANTGIAGGGNNQFGSNRGMQGQYPGGNLGNNYPYNYGPGGFNPGGVPFGGYGYGGGFGPGGLPIPGLSGLPFGGHGLGGRYHRR